MQYLFPFLNFSLLLSVSHPPGSPLQAGFALITQDSFLPLPDNRPEPVRKQATWSRKPFEEGASGEAFCAVLAARYH